MSTQNKEPNFPYCNLTIITPVKTVRDMNMKCPLFWKIETLKKFIRQYHEDFFDYFKQNSWCLILAGKTLEEEETVENIIKKVRKINCTYIRVYIEDLNILALLFFIMAFAFIYILFRFVNAKNNELSF